MSKLARLSAIYICKPLIETLSDCDQNLMEQYDGEMFLFQHLAEYGEVSAKVYEENPTEACNCVWPYDVDEKFGEYLVQLLNHGQELPSSSEAYDAILNIAREAHN